MSTFNIYADIFDRTARHSMMLFAGRLIVHFHYFTALFICLPVPSTTANVVIHVFRRQLKIVFRRFVLALYSD